MLTSVVVLDSQPAFLGCSTPACSLLLAPVTTQTLLSHVRHELDGGYQLLIAPEFTIDESYRDAVKSCAPEAEVIPLTALPNKLAAGEPSDVVVLVDPHFWPASGLRVGALVSEVVSSHFPVHQVFMNPSDGLVHERIVRDADGRVRRVQRYYEGVTELKLRGVGASAFTAVFAANTPRPDLSSPTKWRQQLALRDTPSRDVVSHEHVFDLRERRGLLDLNAHLLADQRGAVDDRGADVDVAPTARLSGRVVLQSGARVGAKAVVVGPTVLGRNSSVAPGALVVRCVLTAGAATAEDVRVEAVVTHADQTTAIDGEAPVGEEAVPGAYAHRPDAARRRYLNVKAVVDGALAAIGLAILAVPMACIALLVKATSRGPIFFGHEREGLNGELFKCWKFRTMVKDAHAMQRKLYEQSNVDGPQFKMNRDPRITLVGRVLRRTNFDELPQLWNVLVGEMSLIGPRPSPFRENQICVPWRRARLSVRPGITGLWQVCRHDRDRGDFHQWVYFDMLYANNASLWLDLRIFVATILTAGGRWPVPLRWMLPNESGPDRSGRSSFARGVRRQAAFVSPSAVRGEVT